jgi:hypothetical protein
VLMPAFTFEAVAVADTLASLSFASTSSSIAPLTVLITSRPLTSSPLSTRSIASIWVHLLLPTSRISRTCTTTVPRRIRCLMATSLIPAGSVSRGSVDNRVVVMSLARSRNCAVDVNAGKGGGGPGRVSRKEVSQIGLTGRLRSWRIRRSTSWRGCCGGIVVRA